MEKKFDTRKEAEQFAQERNQDGITAFVVPADEGYVVRYGEGDQGQQNRKNQDEEPEVQVERPEPEGI